jgi:ElaB/YqjD/DUF883 family membrane-anchored ribosome-binding protein
MAFANETRGKLDDAQAQIARLRDQVETLRRDRVSPAVQDFAGRAEGAMHSAGGVVRDQAQVVSGRVKEQPLIAIMIAAALGWIIGRVMR